MMAESKVEGFNICLERQLAGEPLEQVLGAFPQWKAEFRPLLETAQAARLQREGIRVPKPAQARSRARFLEQASTLSQQKKTFFSLASLRVSLAALVVLLALAFGGFSTAGLAAESLPGDTLYPLKILGEQTRLKLTSDPVNRLELQQTFDDERLEEMHTLVEQARSEVVSFSGGLFQMRADEWLVEDYHVRITEETQITGDIREGIVIGVQGILQSDGSVAAAHVWVWEFQVTGLLREISGDEWLIDGLWVTVTTDTRLDGALPVGSRVSATVARSTDGRLVVRSIRPVAPLLEGISPSSTATTGPVLTEASGKATDEPSGLETEKPEESPEIDDDTPEASKTPRPSETPELDDDDETPEPSETPEPTEEDDEDDEDEKTPEPTKTIRPSETPRSGQTITPEPTETEEPEETPEPTDDD